jgi:hypothetical protein
MRPAGRTRGSAQTMTRRLPEPRSPRWELASHTIDSGHVRRRRRRTAPCLLTGRQGERHPWHRRVVADHCHRRGVVGQPSDQTEQPGSRRLVCFRLESDRWLRAQLAFRELPCLAGPDGRRAEHEVRHVPGRAHPPPRYRCVKTPAGAERPVVIWHAVRPRRLGVAKQDERPRLTTWHQIMLPRGHGACRAGRLSEGTLRADDA